MLAADAAGSMGFEFGFALRWVVLRDQAVAGKASESCRTGVCHSFESWSVSQEVVYRPGPLEMPADWRCSENLRKGILELAEGVMFRSVESLSAGEVEFLGQKVSAPASGKVRE